MAVVRYFTFTPNGPTTDDVNNEEILSFSDMSTTTGPGNFIITTDIDDDSAAYYQDAAVGNQGPAEFTEENTNDGLPFERFDFVGAQIQTLEVDTSDKETQTISFSYQSVTVTYMVCFASNTLIRTQRGDVAVEALAVGDLAVTASGVSRPIRWLGHRTVDCRRHSSPSEAYPIRIAAHAFGAGRPSRDLYLSPGHPVLVGADVDNAGGHLVPIMCLINGTTVRREYVESVTYWHIELDAHDILLAEGLPAESYIDLGSRPWFDGADGALYDPDMAAPGMPGRCRPVAIDGPVVEAERLRLDAVFALRLAAACVWPEDVDLYSPLALTHR